MSASRGWVGTAIGILVGAALAGGPLGYYVHSLQGELREMSEMAAASTEEVERLRVDVASARSAAATSRREAAATAVDLEQQCELSAELAKPEIPLQLSVRRGFIDSGYVLEIRNPTNRELTVAATFASPTGQSIERRLIIPAGLGKDIGESEGWAFQSRDTATFKIPGHKDLIYMIPVF